MLQIGFSPYPHEDSLQQDLWPISCQTGLINVYVSQRSYSVAMLNSTLKPKNVPLKAQRNLMRSLDHEWNLRSCRHVNRGIQLELKKRNRKKKSWESIETDKQYMIFRYTDKIYRYMIFDDKFFDRFNELKNIIGDGDL